MGPGILGQAQDERLAVRTNDNGAGHPSTGSGRTIMGPGIFDGLRTNDNGTRHPWTGSGRTIMTIRTDLSIH